MYRGLASGCEIISIIIKDATREATLESSSGLVAEYIVAIDVTRVRFPADAFLHRFLLQVFHVDICIDFHIPATTV